MVLPKKKSVELIIYSILQTTQNNFKLQTSFVHIRNWTVFDKCLITWYSFRFLTSSWWLLTKKNNNFNYSKRKCTIIIMILLLTSTSAKQTRGMDLKRSCNNSAKMNLQHSTLRGFTWKFRQDFLHNHRIATINICQSKKTRNNAVCRAVIKLSG